MMHGDKHPGVTLAATLTSQQDDSHGKRPGAGEETGQRRHVAPALPWRAKTVGASNVQTCSLVAGCSLGACAMHPGGHSLQPLAWVLGESYVSCASRAISATARAASLASTAEHKADDNALGSAASASARR